MPFLVPSSPACAASSTQGHVGAAAFTGSIYNWGQGVAVDKARATVAYKIAAEGGDANCQCTMGWAFRKGSPGVEKDNKQAVVWYEKAAAQDHCDSILELAIMAELGLGSQPPSWRRALGLYKRVIALGQLERDEFLREHWLWTNAYKGASERLPQFVQNFKKVSRLADL